jgi:Ca2+-transporting ATPase
MARPAVLAELETAADGLTSAQVRERQTRWGPNLIAAAPEVSWVAVLVRQLRSVVVLLLGVAVVAAAAFGERADAVAIAAVLVLNAGLGFVLEIRAHRAVEALSALEARVAVVLRDRLPRERDASELVPGDVILLEAGQAVAADARLLDGSELRVVEATLTGESLPVSKHADLEMAAEAVVAERRNMIYAGTMVAAGTGRAVVVATGDATELGRIGQLVAATKVEPTLLERRLDALGRQLVWVAMVVGAATALLTWRQQASVAASLQAAIALAVAAVPEGLPTVATMTLALGVHRMSRRRALVRRLPSVETLGSVTVLCTDKTGTLTEGAMTVTALAAGGRVFDVTGTGYAPAGEFLEAGHPVPAAASADLRQALRVAVTANRGDAVMTDRGWVARGDPTEAALIVAGRKAGLERADVTVDEPEVGEVPFSSDRKLMATFHRASGGALTAYVKGAPDRVVEMCRTVQVNGVALPLDGARREALLAVNTEMATAGLRVLALAHGVVARAEESALDGLTLAGLAGMTDPPAAGVREAIARFGRAGIRTVMITGDQRGTAQAVARTLGLTGGLALDGQEVDRLPDDELARVLPAVSVFSRVSPDAKVRIVAAFQRGGDVVAMIGDGVNDAAALRKSDVGVTMGGRGTDVARETAAVVLQDDRFETIGVAVEEGRIVFDNIQKFVFYLFSCNLAELLVLLGTSVAGLPLPLAPIQVLWLNLVTDTVPALALALEPGGPDVMLRPPRDPDAGIMSWAFLRRVVSYGLLIALPVFLVLGWTTITMAPPGRAMTMNFMALAFAQLFHLGNARDERPVLHPRRVIANPAALGAVALVLLLQILTVTVPPLAALLHVEPLTSLDWLIVGAASLLPGAVGQVVKSAKSRGTRGEIPSA